MLNVIGKVSLREQREVLPGKEKRGTGGNDGIDIFRQDDIRLCGIAFYREPILFKGSGDNAY